MNCRASNIGNIAISIMLHSMLLKTTITIGRYIFHLRNYLQTNIGVYDSSDFIYGVGN